MNKVCCICQRQYDTQESLNQHIHDEHPHIFRDVSSDFSKPDLNGQAQSQVEDRHTGFASSHTGEGAPDKVITGENEKDFRAKVEPSHHEVNQNLTAMEFPIMESEVQNHACGGHVQPQIDLREFGIHDAVQSPDNHSKVAPCNGQAVDIALPDQPSSHGDDASTNNAEPEDISVNFKVLVDETMPDNTLELAENLPKNTMESAQNLPTSSKSESLNVNAQLATTSTGAETLLVLNEVTNFEEISPR